jgi:hypothetical protein
MMMRAVDGSWQDVHVVLFATYISVQKLVSEGRLLVRPAGSQPPSVFFLLLPFPFLWRALAAQLPGTHGLSAWLSQDEIRRQLPTEAEREVVVYKRAGEGLGCSIKGLSTPCTASTVLFLAAATSGSRYPHPLCPCHFASRPGGIENELPILISAIREGSPLDQTCACYVGDAITEVHHGSAHASLWVPGRPVAIAQGHPLLSLAIPRWKALACGMLRTSKLFSSCMPQPLR